jgi:soluble lytic murein transglycosylase-like protein
MRHALFGPSLLSVTGNIARVFARPLPIMLVLALIITSAATSRASYSREANEEFAAPVSAPPAPSIAVDEPMAALEESRIPPEPAPIREEEAAAIAAEELLAKAAFSVKDAAPPPPPQTAAQEEQKPAPVFIFQPIDPRTGLIEFITGVIAVYYPEIADPGIIARQIVEISSEENVDPLYVASISATESSFKPQARSHKGALGLMQIKPSTAREVSEQRNGAKGTPRLSDPAVNLRLGIHYLKQLQRHYRGNRALALAAYNWGPSNLDEALESRSGVPASVKQYARSILEKTLRWNNHFRTAAQHARTFSAAKQNNS